MPCQPFRIAFPIGHFTRTMLSVLITALLAAANGAHARAADAAAVFQEALPGHDAALARDLSTAVHASGYAVTPLDADALATADVLTTNRYSLLVLPHARCMPAHTIARIDHYLRNGGALIALGLPAWQSPPFRFDGRWISRADYERAFAAQRPEKALADFAHEDLKCWQRSATRMESPTECALADAAPGQALHVVIPDLTGWDTMSRNFPQPFADGHVLTCFRARGGQHTRQLAVEWQEADGSRWIASVALNPEWQWHVLSPEAFRPWTLATGRGGAGDQLRVENAAIFRVGLALTHTAVEPGRHEYWFADLGTARNPFGAAAPRTITIPHIDALAPGYQFFPVTGPVTVATPSALALISPANPRPPSDLVALQPRPGGAGFHKDRQWRWQPLLEARASDGDYRGALAALVVNLRPPYRGSVVAAFAPADPEFYRQQSMLQLIRETAAVIRRGVFLQEGGSEFSTVSGKQPVRLGARVVFTRGSASLRADGVQGQPGGSSRLSLIVAAPGAGKPLCERSWPLDPNSSDDAFVEDTLQSTDVPVGGCHVITELKEHGKTIDRLVHELAVWRPKPNPVFIEARNGGFWLHSKPWKAHGVNYMPSSGIGLGNQDLFEYWIDKASYDPEIVDRDLQRIKAMHLNSISAFIYHRSLPSGNLTDLLRRCEVLGLRVNLSLRPGTPLDFRWNEMKELIEQSQLAAHATVFAYDLAWEPSHLDHNHQKSYAPAWNQWLVTRYGSVSAAERAWGEPMPADGVPEARHLVEDGPWRKCVADYRAFLDDMLREKYSEARRLVRSIDPNHAVSFRMTAAGDPTFRDPGFLTYDFHGLAGAVDVWEPEAYGRIGDWEKVKPGRFTAAYARLCDPAKPLLWAEMGNSVWDANLQAPDPKAQAFQAQFYRDFYRMMRQSGAAGVMFWWYPGGYRVNERSDFGIINPDGTDRPVTRVIRDEAQAFLSAPGSPTPDCWIEVDRDADARGLFGMYERVKTDYWRAIAEGRTPGLRWQRLPGAR